MRDTAPHLPRGGVVAEAPVLARRGVLRRLIRRPVAVVSAAVLMVTLLTAIFAPLLAPHDPAATRLRLTNALPGGLYLLGGDRSGRDILSRLIYATQSTVEAALIATSVALVLGVIAGLVAGYYGRIADLVGSWVADVLIALPGIIVLIALYAATGSEQQLAMVALGILLAPNFFRLVRGLSRAVRGEYYVDAARVSGLSDLRIIRRHVFSAIRGPVIVQTAFAAGVAIGLQAGLAFLGLTDPGAPSWGSMLLEAFTNIYIAPIELLWPGLALAIVIAALVLLGNALRDTLEGARPTVRRRAAAQGLAVDVTEAIGDEPVLSVQNLAVRYHTPDGPKTVVHNVGFTVGRAEIVGLVGESGSGKSQTAFAVLDLLPAEAWASAGSLRLALRRVPAVRTRAGVRGRSVAYVAQEPMSNLDPSFTVGQQLVEGIRAVSLRTRADARHRALELLERVGIADPPRVFDAYPHQISGGIAQRVLIAGAVAAEPELLVADEPTTALDVTVQAEILELLRDLQREHDMAVLLVTHDFGVVADICDRVVVMDRGVVREIGDTQEIFDTPTDDCTRRQRLAVQHRTHHHDGSAGMTLLDIKGLRVAYGHRAKSKEVVHGVDLQIAKSRTLGLVGESGSGKTTIGRAVLGLIPARSGTITVDGLPVSAPMSARRRREHSRSVQVVFQDPYTSLTPALTLADTLSEPLDAQGVPRAEATTRVRDLLDVVRLPADAVSRLPREFSGGQRQRVAIARALALAPKLIVCDEPVSALDLRTQAVILDLLIDIQQQTGVGYLLISHDLAVVRAVSHEVAVMYRGRILEHGETRAVTENAQDPYTRLLLLASPVADPRRQRARRQAWLDARTPVAAS
jgi:peptide/nickel transport system permease protein